VEIMVALLAHAAPPPVATVERRLEHYRSGYLPEALFEALAASCPDGLAATIRLADRRDLAGSIAERAIKALERVEAPEAAAAVTRWRMQR